MKCSILTVGLSALALLLSGSENSAWAGVRLGITVTEYQNGLGIDQVDIGGLADQMGLTEGDLIWTVKSVDKFGRVWSARAASVWAITPVLDNADISIEVVYRRANTWYRTKLGLPRRGVRTTPPETPAP